MTEERILETIRERLQKLVDREIPKLTPATRLRDELGLNSLDAVELVLELEEAFGIELPDEDLTRFESVGDVVEAVQSRVDTASAT